MQLTYRGNTYEMPTPVQFAPVVQDQLKIKLTYRGQQYDYTPPVKQTKTVTSTDQAVALTYRGNTYQYSLHFVNLAQVV
ncbi:MAG: DUF4278 domain-containing protein [Leptolyngbya sp. SIO3F4]|nr:DUF4278 domain-containing protein [Leptolyngbya sp. SIO3F4]